VTPARWLKSTPPLVGRVWSLFSRFTTFRREAGDPTVPPRQPPRGSYRRPTTGPKLPGFGAEPPPPPPPQTWAEFLQGWGRGCGSNLCPLARKVVLARGTLPCDVLFIGEGPGVSEDVTGRPFVGPAGSLLDHIVNTALAPEGTPTCTVAFTNLVGCMPHADPDSGATFREPTPDEIKTCKPRLEDFIGPDAPSCSNGRHTSPGRHPTGERGPAVPVGPALHRDDCQRRRRPRPPAPPGGAVSYNLW
jgi:hypothetical protein